MALEVQGRGLSAALLAAALVSACAGGPRPPELSVRLEQSRDNENRHLLQVVLTNDDRRPVQVVRLQLRAPGFVDVAPTVRTDVLRPGRRLAFPVAYGRADCRRHGSAEVVVGHRTDDGLVEVVLPVPDDDPLLPRLHRRECDLRALADVARVAFEPGWRREGDTARGRLVLRRVSGTAPVELGSVEGSVVFTLRPEGPLPLRLPADGETSVPVAVTPSRCDFHALIESKRSYDFPYVVRVADGEPLTDTVRPDAAGVALLERLLGEVCAPS